MNYHWRLFFSRLLAVIIILLNLSFALSAYAQTAPAASATGDKNATAGDTAAQSERDYQDKYGAVGAIIPRCALETTISNECKNITVFLAVGINIGKYLFSIIGALALGAFVYGGFMMIISSGDPEKVKKGTGAMAAAVIGLVVAFGGYVLVQFLGEAMGLNAAYKLK